MTSKKLELVDSDSICLKMALDDYKKEKNYDIYKILAWVNYDSYTKDWKFISRKKKQIVCYKAIVELFKNNKVNKNNFPYLLRFKPYLDKISDYNQKILFLDRNISFGYKALFKVK